ncbi:thiamine phosphate synthase [Porphyromonadaceae bacterium OttesenSCG-928-L07]|nr:thiamine phosphate synthase [Porphyromonadaceae bacterium OttesenSCG-928-L07]
MNNESDSNSNPLNSFNHLRTSFDLSVYFIAGPENIKPGDTFQNVVSKAIAGGITFFQVRSKTASAREIMELGRIAAEEIKKAGKSEKIALVIDDRLDIALALRAEGVKIDGVHLGQSDIPVEFAREMLGENAIIGLSARSEELFDYVINFKPGIADYLGAGPLHETQTKPDCGLVNGVVIERTFDEIQKLKTLSPLPIVVGGGVKSEDLPRLKATGVDGFFVVSAIASADDPFAATKTLADIWNK